MTPGEELDDLIGAYVLGAVDDIDRQRVERAMVKDALLREEVRRLRYAFDEVLEAQGESVDLSPDLWDRIAGQLDDRRTGGASPGASGAPGPGVPDLSARRGVRVLAIAAAVAVLVGIATTIALAGRSTDVRSAAEVALSRQGTVEGVLHSPTSPDGPSIRVIVDADGVAYALPSGVAPPPPGHEYQLWKADGGTMESLGVMGDVGHDVSMPLPAAARELAVTIEPTGGSPNPTGPPVLVGDLA